MNRAVRLAVATASVTMAFVASQTAFSSSAPSCAPSRSAQLEPRPTWLANTLKSVGIQTEEKRRNGGLLLSGFAEARPSVAFERAREIGSWATFGLTGALALRGAWTMPSALAYSLLGAHVLCATAAFIALVVIIQDSDFSSFINVILCIAFACFSQGCLASVPISYGLYKTLRMVATRMSRVRGSYMMMRMCVERLCVHRPHPQDEGPGYESQQQLKKKTASAPAEAPTVVQGTRLLSIKEHEGDTSDDSASTCSEDTEFLGGDD
jgi:hypothetical protein